MVQDALGLQGEVPNDTKVIAVSSDRLNGTIKKVDMFPSSCWMLDLNGEGGYSAGTEEDLAAAIWACLVALELRPEETTPARADPLEPARFKRRVLECTSDPQAWAQELGGALSSRLRKAAIPAAEVENIVNELRQLGHDLWSYDESVDWATWESGYMGPPPGRRLLIDFNYPPYEEATVEVSIQEAAPG